MAIMYPSQYMYHALLQKTSDQLFSTYRRSLVSSFGLFTTRLWARHIHDRFRDAVAVKAPPSFSPRFPDPDRDITRDFHSHARRAQHRGSRRGA